MKTFVKVLSMLVAIIMIVSIGAVGITAYAEPTDYFGTSKFIVVDNPYEDIDWNSSTLHAFKSSTHAHTVRSDASIELNDTIREHYMKGYEVLALTDHGTVNGYGTYHGDHHTGVDGANGRSCGWTESQTRHALYGYQSFDHGNVDEIKPDEYLRKITGVTENGRSSSLAGLGMFNMPLGNEANATSSNKCHVNTYHISFQHSTGGSASYPRETVADSYSAGAFSRINHIGEWTDGNGSNPQNVYTSSWVSEFAQIFIDYCPNRAKPEGQSQADFDAQWYQNDLVLGENYGVKVKKGVIGIELVNTSDNRTKNDRKFVYDAMLQILAPQGINVYGFCEDDSHEESDVDKNAQYFLVNDGTAYSDAEQQYYSATYTKAEGDPEPYVGYTGDIRSSMTNGEFYASSKNSKNAYELGDGFNATGDYPAINYFNVNEETNQVTLRVNNSTKVRLVADGNVVATESIKVQSEDFTEIVFDLNQYENKINSYIRIYMTGSGGITYLQPILLNKVSNYQKHVQFNLPSVDTELHVYNAQGTELTSNYNDNIFVLPAGTYSYKAERDGYDPAEETFTVTIPAEVTAENYKQEINVVMEQNAETSYAFFYTPETIYLNPADGQTFQYFIDRGNSDDSAINTNISQTGNVYFHRRNATNITITASYVDGEDAVLQSLINFDGYSGELFTYGDTISTTITSGKLSKALSNSQFTLIQWTAEYTFNGQTQRSYSYTYVYKPLYGTNSVAAVTGFASTKNNWIEWPHDTMGVAGTVWLTGVHSVGGGSKAYEYAPYGGSAVGAYGGDSDPTCSIPSGETNGGTARVTHEGKAASKNANNNAGPNVYGELTIDTSRHNNLNQIPYLSFGLDLNDKFQEDSNSYEQYINFNGVRYHTENSLDYSYKRMYESGQFTINQPIDTTVQTIPIFGHLQIYKSDLTDQVNLTVNLSLKYTNKTALRNALENTIKASYQQDWFANPDDYTTYRQFILDASSALGNPTADQNTVDNLTDSINNFAVRLKTGKVTVSHYYEYFVGDSEYTGLIESEPSKNFTYNESIFASSKDIEGYVYAGRFEVYVNGTESSDLSGSDPTDVMIGAADNYEWRFYYTPYSSEVNYDVGAGADRYNPGYTEGNTGYTVAMATYGQKYKVATNLPTKTGYSFGGWYLDCDPTFKVYEAGYEFQSFDYIVKGETSSERRVTFTAKWVPYSYSVAYDLNGGRVVEGNPDQYIDENNVTHTITAEDKHVEYDGVLVLPVGVPSRTGYNFAGWQLSLDSNIVRAAGSQVTWRYTADGVFVAKWVPANYKVSFDLTTIDPDATDATLDMEGEWSKSVTYDMAYGNLPTATRRGYDYVWYSDPNAAGNENYIVTEQTIVNIPSNHTIYADWTPIVYNITCNANSGKYYNDDGTEAGDLNTRTYTVEDGDITLVIPERAGYVFAGWSGTDLDKTHYHPSVTIPAGSIGHRVYKANWTPVTYYITYDLNDDDGSVKASNDDSNPSSFTVAKSVTINPPTRTGYKFLGWQDDDGLYNATRIAIQPNTVFNDIHLTANWEIINYELRLVFNNGEDAQVSTYTVETDSFTIPTPEKEGFTFKGWQSNYFVGYQSTVTIEKGSTGNKTLTAIWNSDDNYISYDLAKGVIEGSNPDTFKNLEDGEVITLKSPVRTGYTFLGWTKTRTNALGEVTTFPYNEQNPVGTITSEDNRCDLTFVANWRANTYNITCDPNGGRFEKYPDGDNPNNRTYTPSNSDITLENPIKSGYKFAGWKSNDYIGTVKNVVIKSGSVGDKTYEAVWDVVNYTIDYALNGGTTNYIFSYNVTSESATINPATRLGYIFDGYDQTFHSLVWKSGNIIGDMTSADRGKLVEDSVHYVSSPIYFRSGFTYSVNSDVGYEGLELRAFKDERLVETYEFSQASTWTTDEDVYVYLIADTTFFTTESLMESVTISVTSTSSAFEDHDRLNEISIIPNCTGNFSVTAYWTTRDYTVTCELDGGTYTDENNNVFEGEAYVKTFTTETPTFLLATPQKAGYNFNGWYDGVSTSATVYVRQGTTRNLTYTARWSINSYSISYDLKGGKNNPDNPTSYLVSSDEITIYPPTRDGYIFTGWTGTGLTGSVSEITISTGSSGNRVYTANWTPELYNITYVLNDNDNPNNVGINPSSFTVEQTVTLTPPEKEGATFAGWSGEKIQGVVLQYSFTPNTYYKNLTFTAHWNDADYNITYSLDGGIYYKQDGSVGNNPNPTSYTVNDSFSLENPQKTGFNFVGWSGTNLTGEENTDVKISKGTVGDLQFFAHWEPIEYSIICKTEGGSFDVENRSSYYVTDDSFTLNNPTKKGYTFLGWTGTGLSEATETVTIHKGSTGNRTYTATWSKDTYNITYNLNHATTDPNNPTSYSVTDSIVLANPERTGFKFLGWSGTGIVSESGMSTSVSFNNAVGDRVYTANWEIVEYTIEYDKNAGSDTVTQTVKNPESYNVLTSTITIYDLKRTGYTFMGWTTHDDEGVESVDKVFNPTIPKGSTGNRYYRAHWEVSNYTITYEYNGGSLPEGVTNPLTYTYFDGDTPINNPVRAGYVFQGWAGTGISGTNDALVIGSGSEGDKSYIAMWKEATANDVNYYHYNNRFGDEGVTVLDGENPNSYITNSGMLEIIPPAKTGYTFLGWSSPEALGYDEDGELIIKAEDVFLDTTLGIDVNFYAHWEANVFTISYNLGGGSAQNLPASYTIEDESFTLPQPTREGYVFVGWYGSNGATPQAEVTIVPGTDKNSGETYGSKRYFASWEEEEYTITYNYVHNGVALSESTTSTYTYTTESFSLSYPEFTGYKFVGWTGTGLTNNPEDNRTVSIAKFSTGNKTFNANYELENYSITYKGLDGAVCGELVYSYTVEDSITLPTPYKVGYTFLGWSGSGISEFNKAPTFSNQTGAKTFTANWKVNNYTISYLINNGSVAGTNATSYTIQSANIHVLNPASSGYIFNGWEMSYVNFTWYEGSIDANGAVIAAAGSSYSAPVTLEAGKTYVLVNAQLALYSKDGKTFVGFAQAGEYTVGDSDLIASVVTTTTDTASLRVSGVLDSVVINSGSIGNVSLNTVWTAKSFNITYNYNGGQLPSGVTNPETYTPENSVTLNNPERTGYAFVGWTGTGLKQATVNVTIPVGYSGDRVYNANWAAIKYDITIDLDGGAFTPEDDTFSRTFTVNTPDFTLPIPRKTGYTFAGWVNQNNESVDGVIKKNTIGNLVFKALWTKNDDVLGTHRIYFFGFNGEDLGYLVVGVGSMFEPKSPSVVVGYQFSGWVDVNGNSLNLNDDSIINSSEDVYVYSNYKTGIDTYDITINGVTSTYSQYATVKAVADATSNGKQFSHWEDGNGNVVSYYRSFSFKAHADTTISAVYDSNGQSDVKATIRITKAEYNSQYDWITFYAERSVYSSLTVIQHGIIFTDNETVAKDDSRFKMSKDGGDSDVYVGTATGKTRSGVYTLSIGGLNNANSWYYDGEMLYARGYIIVADSNGNTQTVYSEIPTSDYTKYLNKCDKSVAVS